MLALELAGLAMQSGTLPGFTDLGVIGVPMIWPLFTSKGTDVESRKICIDREMTIFHGLLDKPPSQGSVQNQSVQLWRTGEAEFDFLRMSKSCLKLQTSTMCIFL